MPADLAGDGPPAAVLAAFGVPGTPLPLHGGRGSSWRVGDVVLKPLDADLGEAELAWQADTYERIARDGFRLAEPLRARDGALVTGGWTATRAVDGRHEPRRWADIIAVGERFHRALAGIARPGFIDRRTNPWAIADRVAWGEAPARDGGPYLPWLQSALRPVDAPSQLVHGDLTGNVLFADGQAPAIIDFSPYWRPPAYGAAVVVADALTWEGADATLLGAVSHIDRFEQYLLRALIFRIVVDRMLRQGDAAGDQFARPVEIACRL